MSSYRRTKITRLRVAGLRSLRDVELKDLPDLVVLHGPNGSGKSTLGRAVGLVLNALQLPGGTGHRQAYQTARAIFGIEPDDFTRSGGGVIELELGIQLGRGGAEPLRVPGLAKGTVNVSIRARDLGSEHGIELEVGQAAYHRSDLESALLAAERAAVAARQQWKQARVRSPTEADAAQAISVKALEQLEALKGAREADLRGDPLSLRLPELIESVDAFRRVLPEVILGRGAKVEPDMLQTLLRRAALSSNPREFAFFESLPTLLADAGLFGGEATRVRPSEHELFGETRFLVSTPHHKDIPLTQLGTGEQQIVALITRMCLRGAPIVMLQEPEAHLHSSTQLALARFLERSAEDGSGPEGRARFDQLWIETHQHSFAIAAEYFDVSLDAEGYTKIEKKPRSLAQTHFYEPGPVFDALRQLVDETHEIGPDQVVFHDADGNPVSAAQLRASLDGDQGLAQQYVAQVTRTVVNMLEKATRRPKP